MTTENKKQVMNLQVTEGLTVAIKPDSNHEFLMPTKQVAIGYDVTIDTIRRHKMEHKNELIEGKHFISSVSIPHAASHGSTIGTMWTKRGIVRLGFFIKSERARIFRDWAEDLVINKQAKPIQLEIPKMPRKVLPEFTEVQNLADSAAILCGSRSALARRLGISSPTFTHLVKHPHWLSEEMLKAIENGCRNIINNNNRIDVEAIEALIKVKDEGVRLTLFNKMKKGGLI